MMTKRAVLHSKDGRNPSIIVEQGDIWKGRNGRLYMVRGIEYVGEKLFAQMVNVVRVSDGWSPSNDRDVGFRVFCQNLRRPQWRKIHPPLGQVEMERPA